MNILDIHTHHAGATQAIINVSPSEFKPEPGLFYSVGIHPWDTERVTQADFDQLVKACRSGQVVAVGETGLDPLRGAPLAVQQDILRRHIAIAIDEGLPLVVHCVRAWQMLVAVWRQFRVQRPALAIHGFRGNANTARTMLQEGFYLSYGPRFNPAALAITPLDRLLIETDDSGTSIAQVVQIVAAALKMPAATLIAQVKSNAATLLAPQA